MDELESAGGCALACALGGGAACAGACLSSGGAALAPAMYLGETLGTLGIMALL